MNLNVYIMVVLDPESEIRKMFVKVPFALDFKVYLFNVTNPMEIQGGAKPMVHQVGPFCYQEFKEKVDISDDEENDFMFYRAKDTFIKKKIAPDCLTGDEVISIPHPMIVGMINTLVRQKPAMLTLATKAINSIFRNPASIFLTAKVNDILFDGVIIDCSVKDFAGKAVCTQLKDAPDLRKVSDTELAFSFFTPKNGTAGKVFKVLRGKKVSHDVGRVIEYDGKPAMEVWPTKECNAYQGSDGTVFPPYLTKEEGLPSFAPDLCRSLVAKYEKNTKYDGIPVRLYTATLGDMSRNKDEKCYCLTEDTCLKKGMFDLYKCVGVPLYVSLPHFYESDKSYVNAVGGLNPNRKEHGIELFFESITGGPVSARKRLQFNMPIEPNDKVPLFNKLQPCVLPMFWVEEGVALNNTFTGPIKTLFKMMKIVKIATWVIVLASLGGMGAAAYLMYGKKGAVNVTPVKKVKPAEEPPNGVTTVNGDGFGGHVNHAMSDNEIDKY